MDLHPDRESRKRRFVAIMAELYDCLYSESPPAASEPSKEVPVTLAALADACGCSAPTMRAELQKRGISGIHVGDHPRYLVSEVRAALREPAPVENVVRLQRGGR